MFITVKTYPTLSKKYDELVCTAGILDDGSWVRVYPLPFRKLDYENRYKKYQWMELPLVKNESDPRPESYKITDLSKIQLIGEPVGTKQGWAERKQIIFGKNDIYSDLGALIKKANNNELSIAIFKPAEVLEFVVEKTDREWDQDSLEILKAKANQLSLFQTEDEVRKEFLIVDKLPYKFSYRFKDCTGKESTLMIEDWEIGALFWNCLKHSEGNEDEAISLVRRKYFEEFSSKEIFLFLGTTRQFHGWAKNPFVIIGVFYPPASQQNSLVLGENRKPWRRIHLSRIALVKEVANLLATPREINTMQYPGGKGASGVYQRLINQIPPHRVYIESHLGGGALMRYKRPAEINIGLDIDPATVEAWNDLTSVQVLCTDAAAYLASYPFKGDEFIYADPPYLPSTRRSNRALYKHEYTEEQHIELLHFLINSPCNVMISGYWSDLYTKYLKGWRHMSFVTRTRSGDNATESVWMNYPQPEKLHDYRFIGDSFRERERIRRRIERWKERLETMPPQERNALLYALK